MTRHNLSAIVRSLRTTIGAGIILAASVSIAAASFGPRITLDGVYFQSTDVSSSDINDSSPGCGSAIVCYVLFQSVSDGQDLLIEHVSCLVQIPTGGQFKLVQLISKKNKRATEANARTAYVAPIQTASASEDTYVVDAVVQYPLKAGEVPVLQLFKNVLGTWQAQCAISGHVTTPAP